MYRDVIFSYESYTKHINTPQNKCGVIIRIQLEELFSKQPSKQKCKGYSNKKDWKQRVP